MSPRSKAVFFAVPAVAMIAAVGALLLLWWNRAPEAARLLPDSEGVIYVNLRPLRLASVFKSLPPVSRDPDYQAFVDATGFQFERDLDEAAIAVHSPGLTYTGILEGSANQANPTVNPKKPETRYSEVFKGRFDLGRLASYFQKNAKGIESYRNVQIFSLPVENRTVRVAPVSKNLVVVSNVDDLSVIHGLVDRSKSPLVTSGSPLVENFYKEVPVGSLAWSIVRDPRVLSLKNFDLPIPFTDSTWVISARFTDSVHLEADAISPTAPIAADIAENLQTLLALFHSIQANTQPKGADPDAKAFFDSLRVNQDKNRAIVTADVPIGFLKKIANGATQ